MITATRTSRTLNGKAKISNFAGKTPKLPITTHIIKKAMVQRVRRDSMIFSFLLKNIVTPESKELHIPQKILLIIADGKSTPIFW